MNCKHVHSLLLDYSDGTLDTDRQVRVNAHLACCADCTRLVQEMTAARGLLAGLPPQRTSAQFEARLAARLALERRPVTRDTWWERLRVPPRAMRPALALCAAAAVVGIALHPAPPAAVPMVLPAAPESALVSQCVAQHQSDVAAQPLADPAAQNLTARLNGTTSDGSSAAGIVEENL